MKNCNIVVSIIFFTMYISHNSYSMLPKYTGTITQKQQNNIRTFLDERSLDSNFSEYIKKLSSEYDEETVQRTFFKKIRSLASDEELKAFASNSVDLNDDTDRIATTIELLSAALKQNNDDRNKVFQNIKTLDKDDSLEKPVKITRVLLVLGTYEGNEKNKGLKTFNISYTQTGKFNQQLEKLKINYADSVLKSLGSYKLLFWVHNEPFKSSISTVIATIISLLRLQPDPNKSAYVQLRKLEDQCNQDLKTINIVHDYLHFTKIILDEKKTNEEITENILEDGRKALGKLVMKDVNSINEMLKKNVENTAQKFKYIYEKIDEKRNVVKKKLTKFFHPFKKEN